MVEFASGNSQWGECKDFKGEGYGTWKAADGTRYVG